MISRKTMIVSQWIRVIALVAFAIFTGIKQWWFPCAVAAVFLLVSLYMLISAYRRSE